MARCRPTGPFSSHSNGRDYEPEPDGRRGKRLLASFGVFDQRPGGSTHRVRWSRARGEICVKAGYSTIRRDKAVPTADMHKPLSTTGHAHRAYRGAPSRSCSLPVAWATRTPYRVPAGVEDRAAA